MALTTKQIDAIPLSGKEKHYLDIPRSGLSLRVRPQGKSWLFRFTAEDGSPKRMSLGTYPTVTLAMARTLAREKQQLLAMGKDPIQDKLAIRMAARVRVTDMPAACIGAR